jgi:hypothetical protein
MAMTPWLKPLRQGPNCRWSATLIVASVGTMLTTAVVGVGCGGSGEGSIIGSGGAVGRGGASAAGGRTGHGGLAGLGGASSGRGGSVGTAGGSGLGGHPAGMGGISGGGGQAGAGTTGCVVAIQAVSPQPVGNSVEAGPRVKLQMRATVSNTSVATPTWAWTVTEYRDVDGQTLHPEVNGLDESHSIIELRLADPGSYDVRATVVEDAVRCMGHTTIVGIPPGPPAYVFRTTATGLPVQDVRVPIAASTVTATLMLDAGRSYAIRPHGLDPSVLLPAYVRITSPVTPSMFEGDTSRGIVTAWLLPKVNYDLLLVPADPSYAPQLVNALAGAWAMDLDQGVPVSGSVFAPDGTPLEDVRLVLRHNQRPSTVGVSGATGTFRLWTRTGSLSAVASPPLASGLPQASVDVTSSNAGIVLPAGASSAALTVRWNAVTQATLSLGIRAPDGVTPIANAHVHATAGAAPAATITASISGGAEVMLPASGTMDRDTASDAAGLAVLPKLPVGTYSVTVTPPATAAPAAVTTASVTVPAAGVSQTLTLWAKVPLTGTLAQLAAAAGARVTALDRGIGLRVASVVALVDGSGQFTLLVDPNRTYELVIDPPAGRGLGRTVVSPLAVGAIGADAGAIALAPGRVIAGTVTTGAVAVPDAFIRVFCEPSAASCVDPTQSLAEAVSRGDGSFDLIVPMPRPD